jgi:hypothetical protein
MKLYTPLINYYYEYDNIRNNNTHSVKKYIDDNIDNIIYIDKLYTYIELYKHYNNINLLTNFLNLDNILIKSKNDYIGIVRNINSSPYNVYIAVINVIMYYHTDKINTSNKITKDETYKNTLGKYILYNLNTVNDIVTKLIRSKGSSNLNKLPDLIIQELNKIHYESLNKYTDLQKNAIIDRYSSGFSTFSLINPITYQNIDISFNPDSPYATLYKLAHDIKRIDTIKYHVLFNNKKNPNSGIDILKYINEKKQTNDDVLDEIYNMLDKDNNTINVDIFDNYCIQLNNRNDYLCNHKYSTNNNDTVFNYEKKILGYYINDLILILDFFIDTIKKNKSDIYNNTKYNTFKYKLEKIQNFSKKTGTIPIFNYTIEYYYDKNMKRNNEYFNLFRDTLSNDLNNFIKCYNNDLKKPKIFLINKINYINTYNKYTYCVNFLNSIITIKELCYVPIHISDYIKELFNIDIEIILNKLLNNNNINIDNLFINTNIYNLDKWKNSKNHWETYMELLQYLQTYYAPDGYCHNNLDHNNFNKNLSHLSSKSNSSLKLSPTSSRLTPAPSLNSNRSHKLSSLQAPINGLQVSNKTPSHIEGLQD